MKQLALCVLLLVAPGFAICDSPVQDSAQDQAKSESNDNIQDNLQSVLSSDPILSDANVQVQVDDQSITLTGTVGTYAQHERALQLVAPYSGKRKIIDKIKSPNPQTKYAIVPFPVNPSV